MVDFQNSIELCLHCIRIKCDIRHCNWCFLPYWAISSRNKRTTQLCSSPVYWHCKKKNQQFIWFTATLPTDKQQNVLFLARASPEWFITNESRPWNGKRYLITKSVCNLYHEIEFMLTKYKWSHWRKLVFQSELLLENFVAWGSMGSQHWPLIYLQLTSKLRRGFVVKVWTVFGDDVDMTTFCMIFMSSH